MKSLLKNIKGGLKMILLAHPVILTVVGLAGITGLLADGIVKGEKTLDEVRNTEIVQELIESEQKTLDLPFEESGLSLEEWTARKKYLESNQFCQDVLDKYTELKEFKDKKQNALNEALCSSIFALPLAVGIAQCMTFYSHFWDGYNNPTPYERLRDSAKADFEEAKRLKWKKKEEKEVEEYKEELI